MSQYKIKGDERIKNMKRGVILIISAMILFLTFCGVATAHPGHGIYPPPEEVTSNQTSNPSTGSTTVTTTGKSSTTTGTKSVQTKTTASKTAVNDNDGDQPVEDTYKPNEVTNTTAGTNVSDANAVSEDSNSSPWNTAVIVGFLAVGLGSVGFFFKGLLFGR